MTASTNGNTTVARHSVVIVGGGFGGLYAARALRYAPVDVTVVDRMKHHLFQPMLYRTATGELPEGEITPPIRDILRRQRNARVLWGDVTDIDLESREVVFETIGKRRGVDYDSLIVAAGAASSYFGHEEFAIHAPPLKTVADALELRGRIFRAFEMAELEPRSERRDPLLTFVIVGAGTTGVELAGQMAELSRRGLKRNFRGFNPQDARIILLDRADSVLPSFPESLQRRARQYLQGLGVEVRLHATVTGIDADGVDVTHQDGATDRIQSFTKVWAGGVQASPLGRILAEQSDAKVDRAGRLSVRPDCSLPGYPEVFVVGDLMSLKRLPALAEVAKQSGRHAARTIKRRLRGHSDDHPFGYHDRLTVASIARFRAVARIGGLRLAGSVAWLMWFAVHLVRLTRFKHRFAALARWTATAFRRGRRQRAGTRHDEATDGHPAARSRPPGSQRRLTGSQR